MIRGLMPSRDVYNIHRYKHLENSRHVRTDLQLKVRIFFHKNGNFIDCYNAS